VTFCILRTIIISQPQKHNHLAQAKIPQQLTMNNITSIADLAHIIQLAVAPVFLLAGISGFLNVMSGRLGRIIDRSRVVQKAMETIAAPETTERFKHELKLIRRRTTIIHRSISLCTGSALLTCVLIVSLFVGSSLNLEITSFISGCFALTMLFLIAALMLFLAEIRLATRQLQIW
jgi:Protein of unknown function (DUF2721)